MSTLKIEERFELDAHPEQAWVFLTQPARLVLCLPGAELTEDIDERNYAGGVKVKLGAVTMHYQGTVEFTELDHERRIIRMEGKGLEKRGGGTVSLTMEGSVHELEGGRCEVAVVAEIRLAGKIVRFGRGMIQVVTAEIFREFTECLAAELAASKARGASDGDAAAHPRPTGMPAPPRPAGESGDVAGTVAGSSSEVLSLFPFLLRSLRSWLWRLFRRE